MKMLVSDSVTPRIRMDMLSKAERTSPDYAWRGWTTTCLMSFKIRLQLYRDIVLNTSITILVWTGAKVRKSFRARRMLQYENSVAKIGFDTSENDPSKNWQCSMLGKLLQIIPEKIRFLSENRVLFSICAYHPRNSRVSK